MDNSKLVINPDSFPALAVGFVRGMDFIGDGISFFRGGLKAMNDPNFPTHAFLATWDDGQIFATEMTPRGIDENPITEYQGRKNIRIVAMYYWSGWDDKILADTALKRLAWLRTQQGLRNTQEGKYNYWGLGRWIPIIKDLPIVKNAQSSESEWCSENCASIHKYSGATWIGDVHQAPDELMITMQNREKTVGDVKCILNYYQY